MNLSLTLYYILKPIISRHIQLYVRRKAIKLKSGRYANVWPIDENSAKIPAGWYGWPEGKSFALVLTHDVDSSVGQDRCPDLMKLEKGLGFVSSFNFVPLRYSVSHAIRKTLVENGFEVGVHGLYHDGKYYLTRKKFNERAKMINHFLKEWNSVGYRAPSMYNKLEWFHELDIEYDASTFDTDPFEPTAKGAGTIFPFIVRSEKKEFVELPYTLAQDFTLFVLMRLDNIDIWKKKLDWVASHGGVALINTHPDYMEFGRGKCGDEQYPAEYYAKFLGYLRERYKSEYWNVLPRDIAKFWSGTYGLNSPEGS